MAMAAKTLATIALGDIDIVQSLIILSQFKIGVLQDLL